MSMDGRLKFGETVWIDGDPSRKAVVILDRPQGPDGALYVATPSGYQAWIAADRLARPGEERRVVA